MVGPNAVRLVELALGVATVAALVKIAVPHRRPLAVMAQRARLLLGSRMRMLYLGGFLLVLAANGLYLRLGLDARATAWVVEQRGSDFAPAIHRHIEGDAVARLQAAVAWPPLTWLFAYVYVVVFPCLVVAAIVAFDHAGSCYGLALVLAGYLANFAFAFPCYVLVPVREAWVYYQEAGLGPPAVRLLLDDISPMLMRLYRPMSGVDNCLPSFHTSLSVTLVLVAWHGGRRLGWAMTVAGFATLLSTLYLGVHWLTDVAAGLLVGALAYAIARRVARRWRDGEPPCPSAS